MRASALARRTTQLVGAQVAFGRFADLLITWVDEKLSLAIPHINHLDIVIRTTIGARRAANARAVVDHYIASFFVTPDRSRGTADHAYGVDTMHAGMGEHVLVIDVALANKAGIVVVC